MGNFGSFLSAAKHLLSEITGEAARAAEGALANLETEAENVRSTVDELMAKAKADAEVVVAAAEPEVKAAVSSLVSQLEADLKQALAQLAVHGL